MVWKGNPSNGLFVSRVTQSTLEPEWVRGGVGVGKGYQKGLSKRIHKLEVASGQALMHSCSNTIHMAICEKKFNSTWCSCKAQFTWAVVRGTSYWQFYKGQCSSGINVMVAAMVSKWCEGISQCTVDLATLCNETVPSGDRSQLPSG